MLLLLVGTWRFGRRGSRPLLRSTDGGAIAALNRAQIERLQDRTPTAPAQTPAADVPSLDLVAEISSAAKHQAPMACPSLSKVRLLVDSWGSRSRLERLALLDLARRQPRPVLLPLLRRALRDPDPVLVASAAAALERYRGRPWPTAVTAALPRARSGSDSRSLPARS